jgi:hypothetical protein
MRQYRKVKRHRKGGSALRLFAAAAMLAMGAGTAASAQESQATPLESLDGSFETGAYASGTHEFYMYCVPPVADYYSQSQGSDYKDAQMKAYEQAKQQQGGIKCWPVWRGLVKG